MKVDRDLEAKTLTISQSVYAQNALKSMGMQDCKSAATPMAENPNLVANPETADPSSVRNYQSAIGTLMYAMTQTRPDLAYSVSTLSKFSANPSKEHTGAVKRVYRYLQGTKSLSLTYRGDCELKLVGYTDSDWGGDKETCRSTSGYVFTLAGAPISWSSRRQSTVALSSTEAEYIAAAEATKEAVWIARFLEELKISCDVYLPVQLFCDNQGAIGLSKNPEDHRRTKHIDIRHHYIREKQEDGTITIHFLPTAEMIADGLTKPLPPVKFKRFLSQLGLT